MSIEVDDGQAGRFGQFFGECGFPGARTTDDEDSFHFFAFRISSRSPSVRSAPLGSTNR